MILAIDPGNEESGYVVIDKNSLRPVEIGKIDNYKLLTKIQEVRFNGLIDSICIEMVACYGMAVGASVFDTCVWIGRFKQAILETYNIEPKFIYRKDEKLNLCHSMKAKDSNIVQALIDRFAPFTSNKGKGTKKAPGWFYGFKKDIWQAYAVGITYYDMYVKGEV